MGHPRVAGPNKWLPDDASPRGHGGVKVDKIGVKWWTVGASGDNVLGGGKRSPLPWSGEGVFVGVHERQLDPKGRLALPASFRPRLEPRCYLAFGQDKCVDVLTAEAFDQVVQETLNKVRSGEINRNQQRALAANTVEVSIDAQGRINIEEKLREYAGLSLNSKVIVAGSFDRVEIWDPTRHQRITDAGTQQIAGDSK